MESTCPKPGVFQAVDLSQPVTPRFLATMKYLGIKKIIRYGDHVNETIKGKTPKAAEIKAILDAGFEFEAVFQHNNRWARRDGTLYNTFTSARGTQDAERMRELYPNLPRWWYGVDFDVVNSTQMAAVEKYAASFKVVAEKYGKEVGAYGSGYSLRILREKGLIKWRWISMSTGFRETRTAMNAKAYDLLQTLDRDCGGINVDFNYVNGSW